MSMPHNCECRICMRRMDSFLMPDAENEDWKRRALRAEEAIKSCSVGACPTLAGLAMEDIGWEDPSSAKNQHLCISLNAGGPCVHCGQSWKDND